MAQESDAVRVAREYREQLARNEDAALRRMSRYWMKMEKSLEPRFFALSQEIKDLQDSGQPVPPQLIYTRQRYQDMMAQIMEELPDYEIVCARDGVTDPKAREQLLDLDAVVLMEQKGVTRYSQLKEEVIYLYHAGREIIGIMIV